MVDFVTDQQCNEIAEELLNCFEIGTLHSKSSTKSVAKVARELLADEGLPTRWSLACVIAKKAQFTWHEIILKNN